jgi:predicted nucleotidyltransferase component of viral defense system
MIPRAIITDWRREAPWESDLQVEQDLIISRAVVEIFSDDYLREDLAFRGGTAIHKLFLSSQARYSEDIDLVRRRTGPIKETIGRLQEQLKFLGKSRVRQKAMNTVITYQFESEIPPVVILRLKIEINCREHQSKFGHISKDYSLVSEWFSGKSSIVTYSLEELLGTKLRALYQRKKGRDLFDIWYLIQNTEINNQEILDSFYHYTGLSGAKITRKQYIINVESKLHDPEFQKDISGLLRPGINIDFNEAWEFIRIKLVENMT